MYKNITYLRKSFLASILLSMNHLAFAGNLVQDVGVLLANHSVLWNMGAFLFFGLLLAFTPCVLPMIPILSGIIVRGYEQSSKTTSLLLSFVYVIGMSLAYALLGLVISLVGAGIQVFLQNTYVIIVFGLVFVLLAFSLFGLFEIKMPSFLSDTLMNKGHRLAGTGYIGVGVMGFLSALIVSPCVTPPLVGALAYIATTGNMLIGTMALFFLGFGMGLPLIAIGLLGKKVLPKAGGWMDSIKFILGFLLLAVAVMLWQRIASDRVAMLLWGAFFVIVGLVIYWTARTQKKRMKYVLKALGFMMLIYAVVPIYAGLKGKVDSVSYVTVTNLQALNTVLADAKNQHKPVFIDFYADWCLDCKSMEIHVFQKKKIKEVLKNFVWIKVDVTKNTDEEWAIEKRYDVLGPPSFVFYNAEGQWLKVLGCTGMKSVDEMQIILKQV